MALPMAEHIKNTFFNPEKTWIPVTMAVSIIVFLLGATWWCSSQFTSFTYRISSLENLGFSETKITDIVEKAVNKGIENKIPSLILELDERYQKKNEKLSVHFPTVQQ